MTTPPGGIPWHDDERLTEQQRVVAELYVDGLSRAEMATALSLSPHTIRRHVEDIALSLPGPGTVRARITRYVRGRRDAALQRDHQRTPMAWERKSA